MRGARPHVHRKHRITAADLTITLLIKRADQRIDMMAVELIKPLFAAD